MISNALKSAIMAVMITLFFAPIAQPAFSAGAGFDVAANSTRGDSRGQSANQGGSGAFAAGQSSSRYNCVGNECNCNGYADCVDMALALECTVIFSPCTGCPETSGYCTPGQ